MGTKNYFISQSQAREFGNGMGEPRLMVVIKDKRFRKALSKAAHKMQVPILCLEHAEDYEQEGSYPIEAIIVDVSACPQGDVASVVETLSRGSSETAISITGPAKFALEDLPPMVATYVPRSLGPVALIHLALSAAMLEDHSLAASRDNLYLREGKRHSKLRDKARDKQRDKQHFKDRNKNRERPWERYEENPWSAA